MTLIGTTVRVSSTIHPNDCGEVTVPVGAGTMTYLAYAADKDVEYPKGRQVVIVDEAPGRVVYVS